MEVDTQEALRTVMGLVDGEEVKTLGGGSNVLASDAGFRGSIIRLKGEFEEVMVAGTEVVAGAGASLKRLVYLAAEAGIAGFEFLEGVPGTVGGALANNSGTRRDGILDRLVEAQVFDGRSGEVRSFKREEVAFGYRWSALRHSGRITLRGRFRGVAGDVTEIRARTARIREYRLRTQPMGMASAGSTFRNPPEDFAGRLIESVGLKGHRIGDAQISPLHANFIVNLGSARAQDVAALMRLVQDKVYEAHRINLEPEVERIGIWAGA
jgi:UDP-N-acetylmuramate dehydrogenase